MIGSVSFFLYIVFVAALFLSVTKKQALVLNALCCLSAAIYFYVLGSHAGAVTGIIATAGSMYQYSLSNKIVSKAEEKRQLIYKLIGSAFFAGLGTYFLYQGPSDLLLVAALIACRGCEIFEDNRKVKLGYVLAEALWLLYAMDNGLLGMYFVHIAVVCVGLTSLYGRHTFEKLNFKALIDSVITDKHLAFHPHPEGINARQQQ